MTCLQKNHSRVVYLLVFLFFFSYSCLSLEYVMKETESAESLKKNDLYRILGDGGCPPGSDYRPVDVVVGINTEAAENFYEYLKQLVQGNLADAFEAVQKLYPRSRFGVFHFGDAVHDKRYYPIAEMQPDVNEIREKLKKVVIHRGEETLKNAYTGVTLAMMDKSMKLSPASTKNYNERTMTLFILFLNGNPMPESCDKECEKYLSTGDVDFEAFSRLNVALTLKHVREHINHEQTVFHFLPTEAVYTDWKAQFMSSDNFDVIAVLGELGMKHPESLKDRIHWSLMYTLCTIGQKVPKKTTTTTTTTTTTITTTTTTPTTTTTTTTTKTEELIPLPVPDENTKPIEIVSDTKGEKGNERTAIFAAGGGLVLLLGGAAALGYKYLHPSEGLNDVLVDFQNPQNDLSVDDNEREAIIEGSSFI